MTKKSLVITIDGPSASGKTTLAKNLAKKLSWSYCDTGALYRAVALFFLNAQISLDDTFRLKKYLKLIKISFQGEKIFLNGDDISHQIRSTSVNNIVSEVSQLSFVRDFLKKIQKNISKKGHIIMEGRDTGSEICPDAMHKFYLKASLEKRALRRFQELSHSHPGISLKDIRNNLKKRDTMDSGRKISPLRCAQDAIVMNSDDLGIDELLEKVYQIVTVQIK